MDLAGVIQILIENPLTVSLAILGVVCVAIAIIGRIPPIDIKGYRAIGLGIFGGLLMISAIGLSWILTAQTITQPARTGIFQEQNGLVVMEAEHFTDAEAGAGEAADVKWQPITTIDGYSGESAVQALPDKGVQPENVTAQAHAKLCDLPESHKAGTI